MMTLAAGKSIAVSPTFDMKIVFISFVF